MKQSRLKELLHYDPDSGVMTWLRTHRVAGSNVFFNSNKKYYSQISIDKNRLLTHRVIWFYMTGHWPDEVDHINGDGTDNRWCNLREVNAAENTKNKRIYSSNTSGVTGVRFERNRWRSQIKANGKRISLGTFVDFFEAVCARKSAEVSHSFHVNHGTIRSL